VLKHKKPPKRSSGAGRKPSKSDPVPSSSDIVDPYSTTALGADPYTAAGAGRSELTPPPPARGKWGTGGGKSSSFLAGFHPSRWGRASSTGPERQSQTTQQHTVGGTVGSLFCWLFVSLGAEVLDCVTVLFSYQNSYV